MRGLKIQRALTVPTILEAASGKTSADGSRVYLYISDGRTCAGALVVGF